MSAEPDPQRGEPAHRSGDPARPPDGVVPAPETPRPPVALITVVSMALVVAGGIDMAANLPKPPPLAPAEGFVAAAGASLLVAVALVAGLRDFAWDVFFRVGGWALLAYAVIAGMLEFVFVFDHTRGTVLVVLTLMLLDFALAIPLLLAFSVARYQDVPGTAGTGAP